MKQRDLEQEIEAAIHEGQVDAYEFNDVYTDNPHKAGSVRAQAWAYGVHQILNGSLVLEGLN